MAILLLQTQINRLFNLFPLNFGRSSEISVRFQLDSVIFLQNLTRSRILSPLSCQAFVVFSIYNANWLDHSPLKARSTQSNILFNQQQRVEDCSTWWSWVGYRLNPNPIRLNPWTILLSWVFFRFYNSLNIRGGKDRFSGGLWHNVYAPRERWSGLLYVKQRL